MGKDASRYRKIYSFLRQEKKIITIQDDRNQIKQRDELRFRKSYSSNWSAPRIFEEQTPTAVDPPEEPELEEFTPTELSFSAPIEIDWFELQPNNLLWVSESFSTDSGQFSYYTEGTAGTFTLSSSRGTISHAAGTRSNYVVEGDSIAMPQVAVTIDVVSRSGSNGAYDNVSVGIMKDASNFIFAQYDRIANQVRFQTKIAGSSSFSGGVSRTLTPPFKLALSIVADSAVIWTDTGSGWVDRTSVNLFGSVGMKTLNYTDWRGAFGLASPGNSSWTFDNFKVGRFGTVGVRDQTIVTTEDGLPIINDEVVRFTATNVDPTGTGYMAVFSLNLDTNALRQDAVLMVSRSNAVQNDLASQIIVYPNGNNRFFSSTWGNGFGSTLDIQHKLETSTNLLTGSHIISGMTTLALSQQPVGGGRYDPYVAYDSANNRWLIAYTTTSDTDFTGDPFYPCLDESTDLVTFSSIGADAANNAHEGSKLMYADGQYWVTTGGHTSMRVYDSNMNYVGLLDFTADGGTQTFPHPLIFPYRNEQVLLTFNNDAYDGQFTWGDIIIARAPRFR